MVNSSGLKSDATGPAPTEKVSHRPEPASDWGSGVAQGAKDTRSILDSVQDLNRLLAGPSSGPGRRECDIVACSDVMRCLLAQARRAAASKASVLIKGESGTGKELLARLIHNSSPRAEKPFVRVNCASLPASLVESELFGHERGAFTGATECRIGRFEWADGGTLLLDEIGDMSLELQPKLLRVLEEEEFERVGGTKTLNVDVRIVATTNQNLEQGVAKGTFRSDLYYRLNAVRLRLPALRARRQDIAALVSHFMNRYRHEAQVPLRGISPKAIQRLQSYEWPGNIRQLRNVVHYACILANGEEIQLEDLPPLEEPVSRSHGFAGSTLEEIERHVILSTLRELGGNKTAAAERLGVTARTLLNKMTKYRAQGYV